MSTLLCRGSIALAAVMIGLLCPRPAAAQLGTDPGPPREPGGLVNNVLTGVQYDIVNQAKALRRLDHFRAKLGRDAERGNSAAVERDSRRIHVLRHRIAVDEWLIRKNSLCDPGYYPRPLWLDPMSCEAEALVRRPQDFPTPPQSAYLSPP
ncbi:hypothetical protein P12x_004908 [Tundrisphaera lichenicola]|uniref:hypothetical protein n=1 Tax=Tundrisphaera lichenicola TaxID=2029860 RepID=UPI003EB81560